jgi:hypothetical protein
MSSFVTTEVVSLRDSSLDSVGLRSRIDRVLVTEPPRLR